MGNRNRFTFVLLTLFFALLVGLWWANWAGVPTDAERRRIAGLVLPELRDQDLAAIERVAIEGGETPIVLERIGKDRWRLVEPIDALADGSQVEVLLTNLKNLRRSPEAGTIEGDPKSFDLEPPNRRIRLFTSGNSTPIAALDLGETFEDQRYVRPDGQDGIEVVDATRMAPADLPAVDWRERDLFDLFSYDIQALQVEGDGRDLRVVLDEGRWRIVEPVQAPADGNAVNGLLASLATLEVLPGAEGFAADNVTDFAPYGLDSPRFSLTLTPGAAIDPEAAEPRTVFVGASPEGQDDRLYVRREGEREVLLVRSDILPTLGLDPNALRSRRLADFDPSEVEHVKIEVQEIEHLLSRTSEGWRVEQPTQGKADLQTVGETLTTLSQIQTSEFFKPEQVRNSGLDEPTTVIRVWLLPLSTAGTDEPTNEPSGEPDFLLRLGRHDPLRKAVYAQVAGDEATVLVLADSVLAILPSSPLALRDRQLVNWNPQRIDRLTRIDADRTVQLERSGSPPEWRMVEPVSAAASPGLVPALVGYLARLRAEKLVAEEPEDLTPFGLEAPDLQVSWSADQEERTLDVGVEVPGSSGSRYARLLEGSFVFTLSADAIELLTAELRDHRLLTFSNLDVRRITLQWSDQTAGFVRPEDAKAWMPEDADDTGLIDPTRIDGLVAALADLTPTRFVQHEGPIPPEVGLTPPRLTIEFELKDDPEPRTLQIGAPTEDGQVYAAMGAEESGAMFLLPASTFNIEPSAAN